MDEEVGDLGNGRPNTDQLMVSVGRKIRTLRTERGYTLEELSSRSGVSTGLISLVERGRSNPSFTSLVQIAHGLDVPIGRVFHVAETMSPVVRRAERRSLDAHGADDSGSYELLTPNLDGALEAIWVEAPPGQDTSATPFRHNGEEFGIVISGSKDVFIDGAKYTLHAGDSITFASSIPHWFVNPNNEPAVAIWVITPPTW